MKLLPKKPVSSIFILKERLRYGSLLGNTNVSAIFGKVAVAIALTHTLCKSLHKSYLPVKENFTNNNRIRFFFLTLKVCHVKTILKLVDHIKKIFSWDQQFQRQYAEQVFCISSLLPLKVYFYYVDNRTFTAATAGR